jgi:S1-C subfamily serine protease
MRRVVLAAAAVLWSGAAFAQSTPGPSQKPAEPADSPPSIAGTVVPQAEAPFLPPLTPAGPGIAAEKQAPRSPHAPQPQPKAAPPQDYLAVEFGKLVVRLDVGTPYFLEQQGPTCLTSKTVTYSGGVSEYKLPGLKETFDDEFQSAGLKIVGDPTNLFDSNSGTSDYVISGFSAQFHQEVCSPNPIGDAAGLQKGNMHMAVDWQLYSRVERKVVLTVRTSADVQIDAPVSSGGNVMSNRAFATNVRELAQSPDLRALIAGKPLADNELVKPGPQDPIVLAGALAAPPKGVDGSVSSVVLIHVGGGFGSGFLISNDGYLLTDAHVVGDLQTVRIHWSDGTEGTGRVVRVSRSRDVALIKTDPKGHTPLPLRRDPPAQGASVFAIGALLSQQLQGTVTRGVVSALRSDHGYRFIQSDVTVGPGDSGGPLLDEQGRVVGLTRSGIRIQDAPQGINYFTPTADALDFLALQLN